MSVDLTVVCETFQQVGKTGKDANLMLWSSNSPRQL